MPFIKCNDINIYYEKTGNGPPLVMINGLGCDTRILSFCAKHLSASFTVLLFDMRGVGQSDKPKEPYTIDQFSKDLRALMTQVFGESAHVVGFSMGGCVAMDLALRSLDLVKTLTLVSTLPSFSRPHPMSDEISALLHRTDVSPKLLSEVYEKMFGPEFKKTVSCESYIKQRLEDPIPQPAYAYLNQLNALENFDLYDEVHKISQPALVVAGSCDQIVPIDNSRWLNDALPDSNLNILPNVGHMIPLEAPEKLAQSICSHIQSNQ
ncbi:MAG: alpha/beta hydrolase [Pseudomonadota bacterium]